MVFEICGRESLHRENFRREIGRVLRERVDHGIAQGVALLRPVAGFQFVRRELHVDGHDVLPGRRQRSIENRRNGNIEIRRAGKFAVLRIVEGALEIIDAGADVDAAGESGVARRQEFFSAVKVGQRVESDIEFRGGAAARGNCCIFTTKLGGRWTGSSRPRKVRRGSAPETTAFAAISSPLARATPVTAPCFTRICGDFRAGANFRAGFFRGSGHRGGERAHAAARVSGVPHRIRVGCGAQQQKSRGAGGPRAERGAENSARGDDGAEQIRFEKFGDEIRDGHGSPADQAHHFFFAEAADFAADFQKLPEVFLRGLFDHRRREVEQFARRLPPRARDFLKFEVFRARLSSRNFRSARRSAVRRCEERARGRRARARKAATGDSSFCRPWRASCMSLTISASGGPPACATVEQLKPG